MIKLNLLPSWILRLYIAVFSGIYLYNGDIVASIIFAIMFVISLLPVIIDEIYNIKLHWLHDSAFSFLIFAHMAGFSGLYNLFSFWDDIAHVVGISIIAMLGFSFLYAYDITEKTRMTLPMVAFFSACFAMAVGGIWEIIEFVWDSIILFSINYGFAQNGLLDTMSDLTWDFLGSVTSVMIMLYYVRNSSDKEKEKFFQPFVKMVTAKKGVEN